MAKATLSLSKKANPQGEHPILIRLDITRTNRPQFKSTVTVLPEYFADGENQDTHAWETQYGVP